MTFVLKLRRRVGEFLRSEKLVERCVFGPFREMTHFGAICYEDVCRPYKITNSMYVRLHLNGVKRNVASHARVLVSPYVRSVRFIRACQFAF